MIEMFVESIRVSMLNMQRVVVLKEKNTERLLLIWIGSAEADAIAIEMQNVAVQRPLTHDLLKSAITELGARVTHILINDLREEGENGGIFFARIVMDQNGRQVELDARPSDAIALAVRVKAAIFVEETVLQKAGMFLNEGESVQRSEESPVSEPPPPSVSETEMQRLSAFRDFINSLDLDDLGSGGGKSHPENK